MMKHKVEGPKLDSYLPQELSDCWWPLIRSLLTSSISTHGKPHVWISVKSFVLKKHKSLHSWPTAMSLFTSTPSQAPYNMKSRNSLIFISYRHRLFAYRNMGHPQLQCGIGHASNKRTIACWPTTPMEVLRLGTLLAYHAGHDNAATWNISGVWSIYFHIYFGSSSIPCS